MTSLTDRVGGYRSALAQKGPCAIASTGHLTLSGFQTIDGTTFTSTFPNLRCLVKDQTTATANGIYEMSSGVWQRARDFDATGDFVKGTEVRVGSGTAGAGVWTVSSSDPHTVDSSTVSFTAWTGAFTQDGTGAVLRTVNDKLADIISVMDFIPESLHDGIRAYTDTTDLTSYFNAAFARIRTIVGNDVDNSVGRRPVMLDIPSGRYHVTSINATNIRGFGWGVRNAGQIVGNGAGKVVFDLIHSRWGQFYNLHIRGDTTNVPRIGIQVGYMDTAVSSGSHNFFGCHTLDNFSLAGFANFGSEVTATWGCEFRNYATTADSYCCVHDGANHWGVTSDYVTFSLPVDTAYPFGGACHFNSQFQKLNGGASIWIGPQSVAHRFESCYSYTPDDANVVLYTDTAVAGTVDCHRALLLDMGYEGSGSVSLVKFQRHGNSSPRFNDFVLRRTSANVSDSLFRCVDGFTGTIFILQTHIEITDFVSVPSNGFFNDPTLFFVTGVIKSRTQSAGNKGMPSTFIGDFHAFDANTIAYGAGTYTLNAVNVGATTVNARVIKGRYDFYSSASATVAAGALDDLVPMSVSSLGVFAPNTGLKARDTDGTHFLTLRPGSNLAADRTLTLTTGDADRTITLSGNPTLDDWFDQSVKAAASPTFASPVVTSLEIGSTTGDTTLTRTGAGDLAVEGSTLYRAGGTDVAVGDGGTGASNARSACANLGTWHVLATGQAASHTGTTDETVLATVTIPAGAMGPNGRVRIHSLWTMTNSANDKAPRIRFGGTSGTVYMGHTGTTHALLQAITTISNRNNEASQIGHNNTTTVMFGLTSTTAVTSTVDTTAAVDLVFSAQLEDGGEAMQLVSYTVEVLYGA